ncbi:TIGR02680 family protein [Paenibacillus faecalis]|uniref:TIGR02680 family protein n=1 Tax=Paenibacillus faecalis TaxID=2079532 RepID=UPI000D1094E3|nr:TIGR02680 family protein [Paenibacillus faecalis]
MTSKWKLNRAGLFNFWYYDNEIFEFEDGKLLLRGTNGSGKSVTMQSLLPVLLDGKKSPDRLDPFGSKSRRMADYLLGEKEVSSRDERTGYLFIEYKMEGTDQYLTTGMGMQAKRNQQLKSWGFVITDNRRIGYDMELYKLVNQNGERKQFPYSQTELTTVIGTGGEVVSSNQDYMKLVNRYVFGFETIEAYDDLIKLLIQLRSPKLSKDFKPTVIYEILEEALPPLTDDDLRYLSDSIEQMDQTKQQMEQLEREVKALTKLKDAYEAYSERIFSDQVKEWKQAKERAHKEGQEAKSLGDRLSELEVEIETSKKRQHDLKIRRVTLSEQEKRLRAHVVFRLEDELQQKLKDQESLKRDISNQESRVESKAGKERETRRRIDGLEVSVNDKEHQLRDAVEDLDYEAEECAFAQHELNVQDYERNEGGPFGFDNWKRELEQHTARLQAALMELRDRDSVIHQFQDKNRELSEVKQTHDALLESEGKWQRLLSDEKQALIHQIHLWLDQHDVYEVDVRARQQMMRVIDQLFTEYEYEEVKEVFAPFVRVYEDQLRTERANCIYQKDQGVVEREKLQVRFKEMNAQRDPEPQRHEATVEARRQLDEQSIIYKPLYEIVEFHPDVPVEVQRRLESALAETGLLDALVTTKDIATQHDRVLLIEPKLFTATLADYLQPDEKQRTIPVERIEAVLQSIEMNGEAPVYFTEDGRYRMGSLEGHALPLDEVRFIGREARRRYRDQLLADLEAQITKLDEQISLLEDQWLLLDDRLQKSKEAWSSFPTSRDVMTCHNELKEIKGELKRLEKSIKDISDQLAKLDQKLQESKRKLYELTHGLALELKTDLYQHALEKSRQYEKRLNEIHREHDHWIRLLEDQRREREHLKELEFETDELRGELAVLKDKAVTLEQQIQDIIQQQQLKGAEDVRREIKNVARDLDELDSELEQLSGNIPVLEANQSAARDKLVEKEQLHTFWNQMNVAWREAIVKEWKRGTIPADGEDMNEAMLSQYADHKAAKDRSVLEGDLTKLYYNLQPDLAEHKITQYTDSPGLVDWMKEIDREEWKPVVDQWKTKNTRNIIEFDQRGVKISPSALYDSVSRELSIQETRLDELDKQLYEEILLNSVGHKLRARIRRAEQWTEQMRELMESRDTSSGLKFSIRWRPRTADSEQELDTHELVTLLKQDAHVLNEDDLGRITRHFRSKIQSAKVWLEEKGEGQTLLQVLKMVLDYRKWFSFVLYYERPHEPRRELTNHHFFKFSGGEKAMAMYIPLFTACYSRYKEAAPSAPYIISLDEAFAGVDENNINEMFEIVEKLGFNYIMNSQVLWGDYETVQSLSVCELVRPKNADYVTVIRYKWNGQELSLKVSEEGEYDE